jgi:outer membrane biosynthesis protein TonB
MPFDPKRIDRLAAKATLLEEQVHALVAELEELAELARAEATAPAATRPSRPDPEPEPVAEPGPIVAHDPEPVPAPDPVAESAPGSDAVPQPASAPKTIPEGARLVALNMALGGTPRDETARYLRDNYDLEDPDPLLDDVYAKVGS